MGSDDPMGQRCPPRSSIEDDTVKLLYCASRGDAKELKRFLEEGVSVNVADYDGRTALHLAASEGHMNCVNLLLQYNANINPRDRWGYTPLSDAKRFNHIEVATVLEAKGGIEFESLPPEYEIDITELEGLDTTPIGSGAFGEVRVVKWRGTRVAAKTILSSLASDQKVRKEFIRELRILQKLHHPNIVQFLGAVTKGSQLVIVTEFLPRGDLDTLINKGGKINTRQAIRFALDIARGMNYLHECKPEPIVHRDLKPRNILLDEAGHLKVADFGLSRLLRVPGGGAYAMTGETGSYRYMAPEVYEHKPYDKTVDVFSFGIITYEIFAGGLSNKYQMPRQVIEDRVHNIRPSFSGTSWHPKLKQLLQECWDKDPLRRPKFADIIKRLEDVEKERSVKCFFSAIGSCC